MKPKRKFILVSITLSSDSKGQLDAICDQRGLLGRLIDWFSALDRTEQSIIMGQVEAADTKALADILLKRKATSSGRA